MSGEYLKAASFVINELTMRFVNAVSKLSIIPFVDHACPNFANQWFGYLGLIKIYKCHIHLS